MTGRKGRDVRFAGQDFEYWATLARTDPDAFERARREAVDALIASAPTEVRRRLEGLQWRVDAVRDRSGTPMAACLAISRMMWDSVLGERGLLETLQSIQHAADGQPPPAPEAAEVIALDAAPRDEPGDDTKPQD